MKIFETHSHYDDSAFDDDRDELISQMLSDNGELEYLINVGASLDGCKKSLELADKYDKVYAAVGVHPEDVGNLTMHDIQWLKKQALNNEKVVAIGEIGLDYYWDENPDREVQKFVFREQMRLAEELNLPVVIHDRDAHADTLEIMKSFPNVKGVVHCFSGSVEFARECVKLGYYIGITGVVTFKNARKICEVVEGIPLERLLVETDCPYMAPAPITGKRNKSDYIRYIIEKIAEIKGISSKEVNLAVNDNFYNLIHNKK